MAKTIFEEMGGTYVRQAEQLSFWHWRAGARNVFSVSKTDGGARGRDGTVKSGKSDGMGL